MLLLLGATVWRAYAALAACPVRAVDSEQWLPSATTAGDGAATAVATALQYPDLSPPAAPARPAFLSVAITSYERYDMLVQVLPSYLNNTIVDEVVIADDAGSHDTDKLRLWIADVPLPAATKAKLRLAPAFRHHGCFRNKVRAVQLARNDWVALLDSDNFADDRYFGPLLDYWQRRGEGVPPTSAEGTRTIFVPALPEGLGSGQGFDFIMDITQGRGVDKTTWRDILMNYPSTEVLRYCNFVVNRAVLPRWEPLAQHNADFEPYGFDTVFLSHAAVRAGFRMVVVPGMAYTHGMHNGTASASLFGATFHKGAEVMGKWIDYLKQV